MRMHMLRIISIDPLFPDDDHHIDIAANDPECGPMLLERVYRSTFIASPDAGKTDAANGDKTMTRLSAVQEPNTKSDDYWLGGYAGI